jgi:hypothetical protein
VGNGEANLTIKGNFKRLRVCDKFDEICSKLETQNLPFMAGEI